MKITFDEWCEQTGYDSMEEVMDALRDYDNDGSYPAMCDQDCYVEPDGTCPHDAPSILLALGLI